MNTQGPTTINIGNTTPTPLGVVWAAVSRKGLWALDYRVSRQEFIKTVRRRGPVDILEEKSQVNHVLKEILEFLEGDRTQFATPIDWTGMTEFQKKVRQTVMGRESGFSGSVDSDIIPRCHHSGKFPDAGSLLDDLSRCRALRLGSIYPR